ncbi:MAG: transketolase [Candidatus Nomurabacteria bacterium]|jgi:transketolase|nr:transketolase [Candidatus Nomurabacteria bacterium]
MTTISQIEKHALNIRRNLLKMIHIAGSGHPAGALGAADIMAALYLEIMNYNPKKPHDENRDILALSNGHIVPAQYAALAEIGAIAVSELWTLRQLGSRLQGHPVRTLLPFMEITSGPLGSGLSEAAGMALGIKMNGARRFVYVIVGDGELDEGNIWEGAMFTNKYALSNLIVFVMRNNIQLDGDTEDIMPLEPLSDKWRSFGWDVSEIDGHNIKSIIEAAERARAIDNQPSVIIAHTIPGKGVSFMEGDYRWHGKTPDAQELKKALEELK